MRLVGKRSRVEQVAQFGCFRCYRNITELDDARSGQVANLDLDSRRFFNERAICYCREA
jgi:hypothetical protein